MMSLHTDRNTFMDIIDTVSEELQTARDIIEKDYYVTMIMKEFFHDQDGLVFKGGTSLSKGYHLINRFSEDIDLNYIDHDSLTRSKRREIKYGLKDVTDRCGLTISNFENTRSSRDFNRYEIEYDKAYPSSGTLKSNVIVETAYQERSYPCEKVHINSIIGEYLESRNLGEIIDRYYLHSFEVTIQSYLRTFIDKMFAVCDYYLSGNISEHSRHLYDLHMILPLISFDDSFKDLFMQVREERSQRKICLSALSDRKLSELLKEVIESDIYKADYENRTALLLTDNVSYEEVISNVSSIISRIKELHL